MISEFKGAQSNLRRRLLSGYVDQQILQGIGIHALGLASRNTMIPYHFFIVWCLGLISQAVHNAGMLSLVLNYRRDWVLRWLRQALMFVNMGLSITYGVYILEAVRTGVASTPVPIACAFRPDADASPGNVALSFAGTIAVIASNVVVFVLSSWFLHVRKTGKFAKAAKLGGVLLMGAIATGAIVRCAFESEAIGHGPSFPLDDGETQWSFGQVLSVLVLLFPIVSVVEIVRGEMSMPPCEMSDGDCKSTPTGGALEMGNFQPNPFFGSQTHLVKQ